MTIDFEDLELPLARLASAGVDAPSAAVRDRIMARVRNDEPLVPRGFVFSLAASDQWLPHPVPGIRMRVLSVNRNKRSLAVDLKSTEWVQYSKDRTADVYPSYQLGWFPDYSDADNYLTPFFLTENFLGNHFSDQQTEDLILQQAVETDPEARTQEIEDIQARVGELLSTVPLLQGAQVAVAGTGVDGVILDASFKFRFAPLTK